MSRHKAKELTSNPRAAREHVAQDMTGRVSHSDLWRRCLERWRPGMRTWVEFPREVSR